MIQIHTWWPSAADPYFQHNVSENQNRINYYGADFTPHIYLDGIVDGGSNGDWETMLLDRYAVDSPLKIELSGDPGAGTVTAIITNTSASPVTGQLRWALTETNLEFGGNPHENTHRDHFGAGTLGEAVTLMPGASITRTESFVMDPIYVEDECEVVVYVQNDGTKEVIQANKIFFQLDEPELLAAGTTQDDAVGGDGNGRLDPDESATVTAELFNLNPADATAVSGVLSSTDPYLTIVDGNGAWPDIVGGASADNAGDTFELAVDASTPWGYEVPVTVTVTANGTYTKDLEFEVPVGSPEFPMGPDAYGYYCYEDIDAYPISPTFDWVEINPDLGGSGTLFTLGDEQTRNLTLPFDFKMYGVTSDRVSICSNGFIALGVTGNRDLGPGEIPGEDGPPNMIAGFWADLNPNAPGGGKVYEWYDAANDRFIIEFSGVEHYADDGMGAAETFQYILYNPATHPTQTGDGQIDIQYLTANLVNSCAIGIEDPTETIGTQYISSGHLNAAAHGIVNGRTIRFTTTPPTGVVAVGDPTVVPGMHNLVARPNPFRSGTTLRYELAATGPATVRIYNPAGALVRTLVDGPLPAGVGTVEWDGRDDRGLDLPAGVYMYEFEGAGVSTTGRIVRTQ